MAVLTCDSDWRVWCGCCEEDLPGLPEQTSRVKLPLKAPSVYDKACVVVIVTPRQDNGTIKEFDAMVEATNVLEPPHKKARVHQPVPDLERARECPWFTPTEESLLKKRKVDHRDFAMLVAMAWEGQLVATGKTCAVLRRCDDDAFVNIYNGLCIY